ncbi:hypothetical protein RFI_38240, partial [Reticulomyxa filosa]
SDESFKSNKFISFQIGNFSYVKVPKNFCCIMGVSGTLKTLVILIGDAAANTKEEVLMKRRDSKQYKFGDDYWNNNALYSNPTYYEDELALLKQHNIPVHAFYVENKAQKNFMQIANISGGRCEKLDINSKRGSDQLTDLVSEETLKNAGGSKGAALVEAYRAKFSKSYTH